MKKSASLLILILSLMIFSATACGRQNKKKEGNNVSKPATTHANAPLTQSAEKLYERLLSSFGDDWMEREADPNLYPDYYGGAFVDNNGTFVVTVTGNGEKHRERLAEILDTNDFKVETVQYSYRQMMRVMDAIDIFLMNGDIPEDHPLITRFAGAYPDVMENRVKVLLTKVDDTTTRLFRKDVIDSPLLVFEQGELPELM